MSSQPTQNKTTTNLEAPYHHLRKGKKKHSSCKAHLCMPKHVLSRNKKILWQPNFHKSHKYQKNSNPHFYIKQKSFQPSAQTSLNINKIYSNHSKSPQKEIATKNDNSGEWLSHPQNKSYWRSVLTHSQMTLGQKVKPKGDHMWANGSIFST